MPSKSLAILKIDFKSTGGLEKQTNLIATALAKEGFQVHCITSKIKKDKNPELPKNITFHFMKRWYFLSFFRILLFNIQTIWWIKKNKPEIVLGIDRTLFQTHIRAGNGVHKEYLQKRKVYFGRFNYLLTKINPLHYLILKIEKKSFESPLLKKIIVNSNMVRLQILKHYRVPPSKIIVIHNGVEWEKMEPSFLKGFEQQIGFSGLDGNLCKYNFLFVGNGFKRKGLDLILLAASRIKERDFNLVVIGKDKNSDRYKKLVKKLGLENKVTFYGSQYNLEPFFQKADSCILPSFYDPFANVTIEALAMGLFTITSKENGAHEIINEKNGLVIKNLLDIDELTWALQKAMEIKKNFQNALAIRNSVRQLDIEKQLRKLISAIASDE